MIRQALPSFRLRLRFNKLNGNAEYHSLEPPPAPVSVPVPSFLALVVLLAGAGGELSSLCGEKSHLPSQLLPPVLSFLV